MDLIEVACSTPTFSIPMRGNETYRQKYGGALRPVEFSIPMRGNEQNEAGDAFVDAAGFRSP